MYSGAARLSSLHPSPAGIACFGATGTLPGLSNVRIRYINIKFGKSRPHPGSNRPPFGHGPAHLSQVTYPLDHGGRSELFCLPLRRLYVRCWEGVVWGRCQGGHHMTNLRERARRPNIRDRNAINRRSLRLSLDAHSRDVVTSRVV